MSLICHRRHDLYSQRPGYFRKEINGPVSLNVQEYRALLEAQTVKNLPAVLESRVQSLGWEDPLGKETATQSKELDTTEWLTHRGLGKKEMNGVRRVLSAAGVTGKLPTALGDEEALRTQVSPARSYGWMGKVGLVRSQRGLWRNTDQDNS